MSVTPSGSLPEIHLPEIHLLEPTGYAGVFQHAYRLGQALHRHGHRVVLHTGHEHEPVAVGGVELCTCSWWPRPDRRAPGGSDTEERDDPAARVRRRLMIAERLVRHTVPHLHRTVPPGAVLHLQGTAATGAVNLLILATARSGGRRVVYSPHDTFSRRGGSDELLLRLANRVPHAVVVYSRADAARLGGGDRTFYSPLVQLVPRPSEARRRLWRRTWGAGGADTVVLFAGFIRPEKRLDVLVEAARHWPAERRLAVVGVDRGGWAGARALARAGRVEVAARIGFVELTDFAAALAAADVVVVPSDRASQSGVLVLARQLGTPTLAADVGGMPELATATFTPGDPHDLNRGLDAVLRDRPAPSDPPADVDGAAVDRAAEDGADEDGAVLAHLRAYGAAS